MTQEVAPWRPLHPFVAQPWQESFGLDAAAAWDGARFILRFRLKGALQQLVLPSPSSEPQRRDGLWQSSCFEAFLGIAGHTPYWEINLCPSGHWNVYALSAYRHDLTWEPSVLQLPLAQRRLQQLGAGDRLELDAALSLPSLAKALEADPTAALEVSMTAVLEHRQQGCSYWAWKHCGTEADFHRRDSFLPL